MSFSFSLISRVRFCGPAITRSMASSSASLSMVFWFDRAVSSAAHTGAAVPADGVDLVDEDDGRGVLLGLLEQVAHPGGADTDEHLDEVGAGDRVERHARLTRDRAGEQGLAGAGRPVQQHTLRDLGAHGLE